MRKSLTREIIIESALDLADTEGFEALTMRALAARLNVQVMSLYHHVPGKAELLGGLHERLVLSLQVDLDGETWDDALRQVGRAYRQLALDHPTLFVLLATRPLGTPAEFAHVAPLVGAIARGGFGPAQQLLVLNVFFPSLNGILLAEVSPVPGHAEVPDPPAEAAFVGSEETPFTDLIASMVASGRHATYFGDIFETCLEMLIAGARTLLPPGADEPPTKDE